MLNKFNTLFSKIILENTENTLENLIFDISACDNFFKNSILPLAVDNKLEAFKARYNTFRLYGKVSDIVNFFKKFNPIPNQKDFVILNPLACFCDSSYTHEFNKAKNIIGYSYGDEDSSMIETAQEKETLAGEPSTLAIFNKTQGKAMTGRWYDLITSDSFDEVPEYQEDEYDFAKKVKAEVPKVIAKNLTNLLKRNGIKISKNTYVEEPVFYIEFSTNFNCLPNESYENETTFVNPNKMIESNNKKGK